MPVTINGTTGVVTPGATIGSINGILKSSSGVVSQAVAGTDYLVGGGSAITSTNTAKAWVNFDGTTSPGTIRSSYNVSSVTKNGTGDYTVNFTTPMSDANYSVTVNAAGSSSSGQLNSSITLFESNAGVPVAPTSSSFRFFIRAGSSFTIADSEYLCAIVFGN
jgi:hypothetical protein